VPHSAFSTTGGGQKSKKKGSSERPMGPRFDHDRAATRTREFDGYDSEDVFSVLRRPNTAGAQVRGSSTAVDDEDPWVDTGSESGGTEL
jgi:hypothetical protein